MDELVPGQPGLHRNPVGTGREVIGIAPLGVLLCNRGEGGAYSVGLVCFKVTGPGFPDKDFITTK